MIDIHGYIDSSGRVKRSNIASDISKGVITREDIAELVSYDEIKGAFFCVAFPERKNEEDWDESYLEKLLFVPVAECFNEEYLYLLCDVACFVRTSGKVKVKVNKLVIGAVAAVLLVAALTVFVILRHKLF